MGYLWPPHALFDTYFSSSLISFLIWTLCFSDFDKFSYFKDIFLGIWQVFLFEAYFSRTSNSFLIWKFGKTFLFKGYFSVILLKFFIPFQPALTKARSLECQPLISHHMDVNYKGDKNSFRMLSSNECAVFLMCGFSTPSALPGPYTKAKN